MMTMSQTSPVALGPTIFLTLTTLPLKGALLLNVLMGQSAAFSSSGADTGTLAILVAAITRTDPRPAT